MESEIRRTHDLNHTKYNCDMCGVQVTRIIKKNGEQFCPACYRKKNLEELMSGKSKIETFYRGQI